MASSFLVPSPLPVGNLLAGDTFVVVGSRPGHLLLAPSSALRLRHLAPVCALGWGASVHAGSACFTASGSTPALSSGNHVSLLGLGVVVPGGGAALGSTRIRSTTGGDGFCEAEAFRVEIEEKRCKSKPALHGSMMDAMVYDQIARTAGDSIDLLVTTMDILLPSSRANLQDALRIATKFIKLEENCVTGEGHVLAESLEAAMDGLREMMTLYVSSTEPLPQGNPHVVLPSLPGMETELVFRHFADKFEKLYFVAREEITREYGVGVALLGSTRIKSTGGPDGFCEAEAFRVEIEEKRCNSKAALHGSMMDAVVYDQLARTAGHSIELLVTTMDKLLPSSRANREDAIRIATKLIKLERDCITGEGWYILADSVDGAMDGLREMWTLYVPSTEPLPPGNGGAVVPSLPGRETEMFFRNLANEFEQMYVVVQEEIAREYGLGVVVPGGNTVLGSTKSTGEGDGLCQAEAFRMEIEEKRCNSKAALHGSMMDGMVYDQIARTAGDSIDLLVTTMDKLLPTSRANHQDAIRIATKFIKLERDCITGEGFYVLADSVDGAMDGLREMWTLYIPSTKPLPPCNGRAVVPSLPGRETESFFRNLSIEFKMLYSVLQEEIMREYGNI